MGWTSPFNMAYTSWSSRGTMIPHNGYDTAMSHYGGRRYGYSSNHHPIDYQSSRYHDYRHGDYPYHAGERYFDYGQHAAYGDEVTYGEHGEPHVAAYRYQPGRSVDAPVGSYGGGYYGRHRGGYGDWHGGGYYDRSGRGYNDRYGGRYHNSYDLSSFVRQVWIPLAQQARISLVRSCYNDKNPSYDNRPGGQISDIFSATIGHIENTKLGNVQK